MNKKKILLGLALGLGLMVQPVAAQTLDVDAVGADYADAVNIAQQQALETVMSELVDKGTVQQISKEQLTDIYKNSKTYVRSVEVLNQATMDNTIYIKARVDVDTTENSPLLSRLNAMHVQKKPHMAVVVLQQDAKGQVTRDLQAESMLKERLLRIGFSHFSDAGLDKATVKQLNDVYGGKSQLSSLGNLNGLEYVLLGHSQSAVSTAAKTAKATTDLDLKVLQASTGKVVGSCDVKGDASDVEADRAGRQAMQAAAAQAAAKVNETITHKETPVEMPRQLMSAIDVEVESQDPVLVLNLIDDLRDLASVKDVYLREQNGQKASLAVNATVKPGILAQYIKGKSQLKIDVQSANDQQLVLKLGR